MAAPAIFYMAGADGQKLKISAEPTGKSKRTLYRKLKTLRGQALF
jgi:hypothetical protein